MLTETEARELLQQAASTIDVRPGVPVVAPVRRSWLVPAIAAAAVLAAVTTGFLVVREHDGSTSPTRPVPTPVTPTPTSTDRIPSVFAYDSGHALRLLANLGLQVTAKEKDLGCGSTSGRALSTSPPVGSRFKPGDPVTLLYSGTGQALCPLNTAQDSLAWKVLDFANGRGQDPGFTSATQFWLNGVRADSTDAFAALSALTREGGTLDPHRDPVLTAGSSSELGQCRAEPPLPAALQSRTPYRFDIGFGGDLSVLVACPSGRVYLRPDGTIDAIAVDAAPQLLAAVDQPVDPDAAALAVRLLKFANTTTERFPGNQTVRFYDEGIFWNSLTAA
ncbi:MAG: hypothetical protein JWR35_3689, partial [Marmoricola sp.]|nr:hypothetical protein [Marmoricola sp.]